MGISVYIKCVHISDLIPKDVIRYLFITRANNASGSDMEAAVNVSRLD